MKLDPSVLNRLESGERAEVRDAKLAAEVVAGLSRQPRTLPCKLFYDQRGSALFDRICDLPEYYLTRAELSIMRRHAADIAEAIGPEAMIIELGSGSSVKTRLLLDHLRSPAAYVPVDISRAHLNAAAARLAQAYPHVEILPVAADYTAAMRLPEPREQPASRVVYFPGSTIGNFEPADAVAFLQRMRRLAGHGSGLLIGVDLKKDPDLLHAAYNDAQGVTAAFNLNMLAHINREAGGRFDVQGFAHYAFYEPRAGRIEMHLISRRDQAVRVAGRLFKFEQGRTIHTESSYKYSLADFERLAGECGYQPRNVWLDEQRLFSVHWLVAGDRRT